jgi:hypothetical protein
MTPGEQTFVAAWVGSALASIFLTARWFWKFGRSGTRLSVGWTAAAGVPGVLILVESMLRYVEQESRRSGLQAFQFPTTLLSCAWFVVGPILLITGVVKRRGARDIPQGTALVQLSHLAMWAWSTVVAFMYAATV